MRIRLLGDGWYSLSRCFRILCFIGRKSTIVYGDKTDIPGQVNTVVAIFNTSAYSALSQRPRDEVTIADHVGTSTFCQSLT